MLAAKRAKGFTPRGRAAALKDLGAHPDGTGTVQVFNGKFGAYVKHGKINATLPRDKTPDTVTLDEAVALIAEREARARARSRSARLPPRRRRRKGRGREGSREKAGQKSGQEGCEEGGREGCGLIKGKKAKSRGLPSEAALLEFIQTSPSVVGKREIARAFGLTGADKIGLKALLRQLEQSGKLAKSRRKLIDTSTLPPVTVIEVIGH